MKQHPYTVPAYPKLPASFLEGLIAAVGLRRDIWKALSYEDLDLTAEGFADNYLSEFQTWNSETSLLPDPKRHCLFQYDVDDDPVAAEHFMRFHMKAGVPAAFMIFNKKVVNSFIYSTGSVVEDHAYSLDPGLLKEFSKEGGVIGYHCNVWERSGFSLPLAEDLFRQDVEAISDIVPLKYFSMHGGPADKAKRSNNTLPFHELAEKLGLIWVHNGTAVRFHAGFDDGGNAAASAKYKIKNPFHSMSILKPGQRLRFLLHTQYYVEHDPQSVSYVAAEGLRWWEEYLYQTAEVPELLNRRKTMKTSFANVGNKLADKYFSKKRKKANSKTKTPARSKSSVMLYEPAPLDLALQFSENSHEYWLNCHDKNMAGEFPVPSINTAFAGELGDDKPVFVHGLSRSGTTIMCSVFDAHPEISMSYELYPAYLVDSEARKPHVDYTRSSYLLENIPSDEFMKFAQDEPYKKLRTFVASAGMSGITPEQVGMALRAHLRVMGGIRNDKQALSFIGRLAKVKAAKQKKPQWGAKCATQFAEYHRIWPNARFIYMLRNGLDIFASQKTKGNFKPEAKPLAQTWLNRLEMFQQFRDQHNANGYILRYEDFALEPEKALRNLCQALDIEFDNALLNHSAAEQTLQITPFGQLSAKQVAKPINTDSLGSWESILSDQEVDAFVSIAGKKMEEAGYLL